MLHLRVKDIDMARLSRVLVKHSIKANISKNSIVINGNISKKLLTQLCNDVEIISIHNFESTQTTLENSKLTYSQIKKGEVYLCDFGEPFGCEIGGCRPVIVITNNRLGMNPTCSIVTVIPCTTSLYNHPSQLNFEFSSETMSDYSEYWFKHRKPSSASVNQIRSVDKARLIKYLGRMNLTFMNKLQDNIKYTLDLDLNSKE